MLIRPATAFRAAEQVAKTVVKEAHPVLWKSFLGGCVTGGISKSAGSIYRLKDDHNAPHEVLENTKRREALTVTLTTLCSGAVKTGFDQAIALVVQKTEGQVQRVAKTMARNSNYITIPIIFIGSLMAECLSRKVAPRDIWTQDGAMKPSLTHQGPQAHPAEVDDDDDDEADDDDHHTESRSAQQTASQPHWNPEKKTSRSLAKPLPLTFAQASSSPLPTRSDSTQAQATPFTHPFLPFNPFQGAQPVTPPRQPLQQARPTSGFQAAFSL